MGILKNTLTLLTIIIVACANKPYKETSHSISGSNNNNIIKAYFPKGMSESVKLFYSEKNVKIELASYSLHNTMDSPFCVRQSGDTILFTYTNDQIKLKINKRRIKNLTFIFKTENSDIFWKCADSKECLLIND